MDVVFLVGRILFSLLFLFSAIGHLTKADAMAQYASYKKAPGGKAGVIVTGVMLLVGAVSVLLGIYGDLGSLVLIAFLVPTTYFMHAFWKESDATAKLTEQVAFNKNTALIGAALALFVLFAGFGSQLGLTVTGPLF